MMLVTNLQLAPLLHCSCCCLGWGTGSTLGWLPLQLEAVEPGPVRDGDAAGDGGAGKEELDKQCKIRLGKSVYKADDAGEDKENHGQLFAEFLPLEIHGNLG